MNEIDRLKLEDNKKVWWVMDPTERSSLNDIYFTADLRSIQLQAINVKGCRPGLTLYMSYDNARRDAELRIRERDENIKTHASYVAQCCICNINSPAGSNREEALQKARAAGWTFNKQGDPLCTDCPAEEESP